MGTLLTLCIVVAVIGLVLIILGSLPVTSAHVPGGIGTGITLLVVGVLLYVVISLLTHSPA